MFTVFCVVRLLRLVSGVTGEKAGKEWKDEDAKPILDLRLGSIRGALGLMMCRVSSRQGRIVYSTSTRSHHCASQPPGHSFSLKYKAQH